MKDTPFFEEVVRGFIQNKIEKTFLDYYLLEDQEALDSFSRVENYHGLNPMEACLLVAHLCRSNQIQIAE